MALLVLILLIAGLRYRSSLLAEEEKTPTAESQDSLTLRSHTGDLPQAVPLKIELNAADTSELQKVKGIGKVLSKRIVSYRELIGGFTEVEQLMKLHGMSPENYLRIAEQVYVDTDTDTFRDLQKNGKWAKAQQEKKQGRSYTNQKANYGSKKEYQDRDKQDFYRKEKEETERELLIVDVNLADTALLDQVRGIGPKTAARIVKKRKELGFFHSLEQMREEVYGISDENFDRMRDQLTIGDNLATLPHLHVNQATYEQLEGHRYISKTMARLIVAFREEHGAIIDEEALRGIYGLKPESVDRVLPYLTF